MGDRKHLLTIALEDYFQGRAFRGLTRQQQWYRFEARLTEATEKTLALLNRFDVKATFFVVGWVAERWPDLVRRVAGEGHEIANRGYYCSH